MKSTRQPALLCAALLAAALAIEGAAAGPAAAPLPWKLTLGEYAYGAYSGTDANLRWRGGDTDAWAGIYMDRTFGTQARLGADTAIALAKDLQVQPSLQVASHGFAGGSLNLHAIGI